MCKFYAKWCHGAFPLVWQCLSGHPEKRGFLQPDKQTNMRGQSGNPIWSEVCVQCVRHGKNENNTDLSVLQFQGYMTCYLVSCLCFTK